MRFGRTLAGRTTESLVGKRFLAACSALLLVACGDAIDPEVGGPNGSWR